MSARPWTTWLALLARVVTGGVWLVAGGLKLPEPSQSVSAVRAYDLLPEAVVPTVGQLLPILEVVVGALLVLGLLTRGAGAASAVLQLAFIIGIASVWARGMTIDCGCFGGGGADPRGAEQYPWDLARDTGLMLASLYLVLRPRSPFALDNVLFGRREDLVEDEDEDDPDRHDRPHTDHLEQELH